MWKNNDLKKAIGRLAALKQFGDGDNEFILQ